MDCSNVRKFSLDGEASENQMAFGGKVAMSDWDAQQYLQFQRQRTQPAVDLIARIIAQPEGRFQPNSILDIGCGPGNSTAALKAAFPGAKLLGLDSSRQMIEKAQKSYPDIAFRLGDARELTESYDLLFSNACLQWIPRHDRLLPYLMGKLKEGGMLGVQMPMNQEEPLFRIIGEVAASGCWGLDLQNLETNETLQPEQYLYCDILSGCAGDFQIWESVYYHNLPSHDSLLDWVRGSRLRPYLDVLGEEKGRQFEEEITRQVKAAYPVTRSGEVLLRFRRFFLTARRQ